MERDFNFSFNSDRFDQQPFFNDRNSQKNDSIGNNSGGVRSERDQDFDMMDDFYQQKVQHKIQVQNQHKLEQTQNPQIGPVNNPALKSNHHKQPQISMYDIESNLSSKNISILTFKKTLQMILQCLNSFSIDELRKFIRLILDLPAFDETFEREKRKNKKMEVQKNQMDEVSSDLSAKSDTAYRLPSCGLQTIFQIVCFLTELINKCTQIDNMHLIPVLKEVLDPSSRFFNLPLKPQELISESSQFVQNSNNDQRYQEIEEGIQNSYISLFQFSDEISQLRQIWYFYFGFKCLNNCFKGDSQSYNLSTKMKVQSLRILNELGQASPEMFVKFHLNREEHSYIVTEKADILKMQKPELEDYCNALFDFSHQNSQKITLQLSPLISTLIVEQNSIDKKSLALKIIDKLILNCRTNTEITDSVCKILQENSIINCFLKDQTHSQLLRKLPSIVKFLYDLGRITITQIKILMENAIKGHEQFFKVIQSIIQNLHLKDLQVVFEHIRSRSINEKELMNPHTLGFVQSIVKNIRLTPTKKNKNKKSREETNHSQEEFAQKNNFDSNSQNQKQVEFLVYELFGFLYKLVQDPKLENLYIPILCRHISVHVGLLFPLLEHQLSARLITPKHYESHVIEILNHCLKLDIDSIIENGQQKNKITEEIEKGVQYNFIQNLVINCNLYDSIFVMLCKNRFDKNITQKCLSILVSITKHYKPLQKGQIETLWNILGLHSSNQFEKQQFFQFIKELLKNATNLSEESAKHIYFEIILKLNHEWFTPKIYDCFEILFVRLNEDAKLLAFDNESKDFQNHSYFLNSPDLIGIEKFFYLYFWTQPKVSKKVKDFLFKLFSFKSSPQNKQKLSSQFIQSVMCFISKELENQHQNLKAHTSEQFDQHVNKGFQFFSKFVEGSQKQNNQNGDEQNLITVNINNVTKQALPPVKKTIQVKRNLLLKDLKELIRKEINPRVENIELINKGKPLKVEKMTLKELRIQNRNTILVENMDVAPLRKEMEEKQLRQSKQTLLSIFGEQYRAELLEYVAEKCLGEHMQKICEWVMNEQKMKEIEEEMKSKNEGKIEEQKDLVIQQNQEDCTEILTFGQLLSRQVQKLLDLIQVNVPYQKLSTVQRHWSLIKKLPINAQVGRRIERQLSQEDINFESIFQACNQARALNVQTYVWFWLRRILERKDVEFRRRVVMERRLETFIVDKLQTLIQNQLYSPQLYHQIISTHQTIIQGIDKNQLHSNISIFRILDLTSKGQTLPSSNQHKQAFCPNDLIKQTYQIVCNLNNSNLENQQTHLEFVQFNDKFKTYQSTIRLLSLCPVQNKLSQQILSLLLFNLLKPQNRTFGSVDQSLSPLINKTDLYFLISKYKESFLRFYLSLYVLDSTRSSHRYRGNQTEIDFYTQNYSDLRNFLFENSSLHNEKLDEGTQKRWLYFLLMAFIDLITFYEAHHQVDVYKKVLKQELFSWIDKLVKNFSHMEQNQLIGILALINKIAQKVLNNSQSINNILSNHQLDQLQNFVSFLSKEFIFQIKGVPILTQQLIKQQYYSLMLKLSSSSSELLIQIASYVIKFGVEKRNHDHDNIDFRKNDFVGIQNLGCTCYINSLIQQLYHTKLPYKLLTIKNQEGLFELNHTFMQLYMSIKNAINIRPMIQQVKFYGQEIIPTIQQDVEEFLISLLDYIESCDGRSIIDSIFGGSYSQELTYFSEREEGKFFKKHKQQHFYNVTLDIKGKKTLDEALVYFFRSQTLDDKIFCEELGQKTSAVKRSFIKHFPKIMIFTLKRFEFDVQNMVRNKLNDYFQFPLELDLTDFSLDQLSRNQNVENQMKNKNQEEQLHFYTLCGILIHSGSAEAGHYYSYIKRQDKWYEFNDRIVSEINLSEIIKEECFGGGQSKSRNAYMLFYERQDIYDQQENFEQQKGQKMEIEYQEGQMDLELDKTTPLQEEEQHHGIFLSQVPEDNYFKQLVREENDHFIKERLVYDSEYRKFIPNLISLIREAKEKNPYQTESDKRKEYLLSEKLVQLEKINSIINPQAEKPVVHFQSNQLMEVEEMKEISYEDEERIEEERRKRNRQTDIVEDILNENNLAHDFI